MFSSKKEFYIVSLLIIVAFVFRVLWLHQNLFFGFEQGRDMLKVSEILHGDITLLGPKTDIDGVFHGAMSYYILIPFFLLTSGSPYGILVSLILLHAFSIVLLYLLIKKVSDKNAAIFSCILFSVSYPLIIYARWLSNPNLVVPLTILIFFALVYAKDKAKYLLIASSAFALLIHLQVAVAVLLIIPILFLGVKEKLYKNKIYLAFAVLIFLLIMSPYFIFEIKNGFLMTHSFINHFKDGATTSGSRAETLNVFVDQLMDFFFIEKRWASLLTLISFTTYAILYMRKNFFVVFTIISILTPVLLFFLTGFNPLRHFYNAEPVFIIILIGLVTSHLFKNHKVLALAAIGIILFSNIQTFFNRVPENVANFLYHAQRMYLSDEKNVIDYAYAKADKKPFSYDYYSIPYWKSEAWEYMFNWYGVKTYGYRPVEKRTDVFYVFMEPDESQPQYQHSWYEKLSLETKLLDTYKSRHLTVEQRTEKK